MRGRRFPRRIPGYWLLGCICMAVAIAPSPAAADDSAAASFQNFCVKWMAKLARIEKQNLKRAEPRKDADPVTLEYTGYSPAHFRCDIRATGHATNPYVGKLGYEERRYQRAGATRALALSGSAALVDVQAVTEIFRFDGARWVY